MKKGALILLAFWAITVSAIAQYLSPQQLSYLRNQFIREVEGSINGSSIATGTLPADRLTGSVPAANLDEADPVASVGVTANSSSIATLSATDSALSSSVSVLNNSVSLLQSQANTSIFNDSDHNARLEDLEAEAVLVPVGITTNFVIVAGTQTNTFTFTSGLLTDFIQAGP